MGFITGIWKLFQDNILTQPAFMIGFIVLIGYLLLKRPWYDTLAGTIKAIVGYMILAVGSGGLINSFRPIIVGLKDRFNLSATVIDPYFGQNAVTAAMEAINRTFGDVMLLMAIAFVMNIVLVRLNKFTKLRSVFTTGNVQIQQAATAYWLILFAVPALGENRTVTLIVMSILLGLYWAVGTNLTVKPAQELTDGAGFAVAHQQMFGIALFSKIAEKMGERDKRRELEGKKTSSIFSKKLEDISLPGWTSIFNDNMVVTSILMTLFFGTILLVLGKDYLVASEFMKADANFFFYILKTSFNFAVFLAILQLGVRTFVAELTVSFQGIAHKWLPGAVPGVDCAVTFSFGSPNAVTVGFLAGAIGQFLAIGVLLLMKSPVIIVAGFIPLFFDNATIGVFANNKGGLKACLLLPFICGLCQVFGSAFIAHWVGLDLFGGYLGMWDWAVVWPGFTVAMKYLGYIGIALIAILLIAIPQIQYRKERGDYFLLTEDYQAYKAKREAEKANK